jgi:hypothetical protein
MMFDVRTSFPLDLSWKVSPLLMLFVVSVSFTQQHSRVYNARPEVPADAMSMLR